MFEVVCHYVSTSGSRALLGMVAQAVGTVSLAGPKNAFAEPPGDTNALVAAAPEPPTRPPDATEQDWRWHVQNTDVVQ